VTVSYSEPLASAVRRTRVYLFRPFDLMRWLGVGLTAWLAVVLDGDWWGSGINNTSNRIEERGSDTIRFFEHTYQTVAASIALTVLALFVILVLITISVILLWVSSRARFMFLDNVVRDRSEIKTSWARFRDAGWSLFLWRLGFGVVTGVIALTVLVVTLILVIPLVRDHVEDSRFWVTLAFAGGGLLILGLLAKFVDLLLDGFVVPIMYRTGLPVTEAWRRFFPLLRERLLEFVLFALLALAIHLGVFLGVVVLGLLTCCVGFVLLTLPYVNAVILLPVLVFFRLFPVEFLNQFDEGFRIDLGALDPPRRAPTESG